MSKMSALIIEATGRYPNDRKRQTEFIGEVIGKLAAQQLESRASAELSWDECIDAPNMVYELLEALRLPDGPVHVPGGQTTLFESVEELNRYVQQRMPVWTKELQEAP